MSSNTNILPFIFARLTDEYEKNDKAVIKDWIVVIAEPDFRIYDSRWMCDSELGGFCYIPDVDIKVDENYIFPDFDSARKFVKQWWKNN